MGVTNEQVEDTKILFSPLFKFYTLSVGFKREVITFVCTVYIAHQNAPNDKLDGTP